MPKAERQLIFSVEKFHELYIYLLAILQELHQLRMRKLEAAKEKRIPSAEDLNPNRAFIDNVFLRELEANKELNEQTSTYKIQWDEDRLDLIKDVHSKLMDYEPYQIYVKKKEHSEAEQLQIVIQVFKDCIANNELVQNTVDDASIFWSDDLDLASSMVLKTIKAWKGKTWNGQGPLLPLFKEEKEERDFMKDLFRTTITMSADHENRIADKASNWDLDRIAYSDMVLMKMALAEARTFKSIPTKVTMNEYIELSKYYSTPKSAPFINGVLDKLFIEMKTDGEIKKIGRGLLES
ncbi:MAG: transcription antitermination protein NusB, partial [Bacteroidetes bacterium]|nr:transcription antitermination protein NusB [Bacteroidota bacterium]